MKATEYFKLRDDGKVTSKTIFLHDYETVVESFTYRGSYWICESHVNSHKETVEESIVHEFKTPDEANKYFLEYIKTRKGFIERIQNREAERMAEHMMNLCGTLD